MNRNENEKIKNKEMGKKKSSKKKQENIPKLKNDNEFQNWTGPWGSQCKEWTKAHTHILLKFWDTALWDLNNM